MGGIFYMIKLAQVLFYFSFVLLLSACGANYLSTSTIQQSNSIPQSFNNEKLLQVSQQNTTNFLEDTEISIEDFQNGLNKMFHMEHLKTILELALQKNTDILISKERIIQAQAQLNGAWGSIFPTLSAGADTSSSRTQTHVNPTQTSTNNSSSVRANLSWEIDLLGKNWLAKNALQQSYFQSLENLKNIQISLLAEVASSYFTLKNINDNLNLTAQNIALYEQILEIVRLKTESGLVDSTELFDAQDDLTNTKISFEQLKTSKESAKNALLVLLDLKALPSDLEKSLLESSSYTHPIEVVLEDYKLPQVQSFDKIPAQVILTRPDVKAQVYALYAQNYNKASTRAALFPSLSINGSLQEMLNSPTSLVMQIAGSITAPLLNRATLNQNYTLASSQLKESELTLTNTINTALSEIENTLFDTQSTALQLSHAKERLQNAREYFSFFSARYEVGLIDSWDFYRNQVSLNSAQISINDTYLKGLQSYITLFKVFGGRLEIVE